MSFRFQSCCWYNRFSAELSSIEGSRTDKFPFHNNKWISINISNALHQWFNSYSVLFRTLSCSTSEKQIFQWRKKSHHGEPATLLRNELSQWIYMQKFDLDIIKFGNLANISFWHKTRSRAIFSSKTIKWTQFYLVILIVLKVPNFDLNVTRTGQASQDRSDPGHASLNTQDVMPVRLTG